MLASLQRQTLVAHILQGDNLAAYLLLRELTARYGSILSVVGAIYAAINAVVREIEGRKHNYAVAIDALLEASRTGAKLAPLKVTLNMSSVSL